MDTFLVIFSIIGAGVVIFVMEYLTGTDNTDDNDYFKIEY